MSKLRYIIWFFSLLMFVSIVSVLGFIETNDTKDPKMNSVYMVYNDNALIGQVSNEGMQSQIVEKIKTVEEKNTEPDVATKNLETNTNIKKYDTFLTFSPELENQVVQKVNENTKLLDWGYKLTVDKKEYYLQEDQDIQWVKDKIIETELNDSTAYLNYKETGVVQPFTKDGVKLLKMEFEDKMEVEKKQVPIDEVITKKEDLLFELTHNKDEPKKEMLVTAGVSLEQIAKENNLTIDELRLNNPELAGSATVFDGQKLIVNKPEPQYNLAVYTQKVVTEEMDFRIEKRRTKALYLGQEQLVSAGKKGVQEVTYLNKSVNGKLAFQEPTNYNVLELPISEIYNVGDSEVPGVGTGTLTKPIDLPISCGYGCYNGHKGSDFQTGQVIGIPIYAADNGVITAQTGGTWDWNGYGNLIEIDHNNGYFTRYGHLMEGGIRVSPGQKVAKGDLIGYSGNSGLSTGPHLHFELRYGSSALSSTPFDSSIYLDGSRSYIGAR